MAESTLKGFAGLRNDVSSDRFEAGDLEAAVNVDIDDSGKLSRRDGYLSKLAGNIHSLWSNGTLCLFVSNGEMKRLNDDYTATVLRTGLSNERMAYVEVNGRVYFSNGVDTGIVDNGNVRTWGIVPPMLPLATQAGGNLPEGIYQYALTYVREDGQESGTGLAGRIDATGGIAFSSIPVSGDPGVTHKILYVTEQNGEVLYRAKVLANDATSYTWTGGILSIPLATQYLEQAPAGEIVTYHYGTMYVVQDDRVFYSSPFGYELFDPNGFLPFDSQVQIFAPVEGGIWVGTQTAIYWLDGVDADKLQKITRARVGNVKGTLAYINNDRLPESNFNQPDSLIALWWSDEGVCAGYSGGSLNKLTNKRYQPGIEGVSGTGIVRKSSNKSFQYLAIINH